MVLYKYCDSWSIHKELHAFDNTLYDIEIRIKKYSRKKLSYSKEGGTAK